MWEIPTLHELVRISPLVAIVCAVVYFGWWLRGVEAKALREWIQSIVKKDD